MKEVYMLRINCIIKAVSLGLIKALFLPSCLITQELESPNSTTDEFNLSVNCHLANLVIPPKKGTAIMWYNNFIDPDSGLLGSVDRYSLHGGCDVIKGEKWIANNWLTAPTKYSRHIKSLYDTSAYK